MLNKYNTYTLNIRQNMHKNTNDKDDKKISIFYEKNFKKLLHFTEKYVRIHECLNGVGKLCPFQTG